MTVPTEPASDTPGDPLVGAAPAPDAGELFRAGVWRDLGRDAGAGNGQPAVLEAILKAAFQLFPGAGSGGAYRDRGGRARRGAVACS